MERAGGDPGYNSILSKVCGTVAETLRQNGYNTAWFGKNHNIPTWEQSSVVGPFDHWPRGMGFEYFYGFVAGDCNQWAPPAYENQGVSEDMLIDFTPELRKEALELIKNYKIGPIFTPPVESTAEGPWATLVSSLSGSNWMGGSMDPETGVVYVGSSRGVIGVSVVPSGDRSDVGYISGRAKGAQGATTVKGLPLLKPPYGQISAIDLKTGTILWQTPHGDTADNIKNNPALKGVNIGKTGRAGAAITLVTKTLVIAGEKGTVTMADGRVGAMLRAYDKLTGKEAGAVYMPAQTTGGPMTYMVNGVQYIVIAVGGNINGKNQAQFMAYRLPGNNTATKGRGAPPPDEQ